MSIINCTITFDALASQSDSSDEGIDADIIPLIGGVTLTPQFRDEKFVLAPGYAPRPAGFMPRQFTGYVDTDGQLKAYRGGPVGVRVWANDPVFGLDRLVYRVDWDLATPMGDPVKVAVGYLEAPSTDITVNLTDVLEATGHSSISTPPTFYTLDGVASPIGERLVTAGSEALARAAINAATPSDVIAAVAAAPTVTEAAAAAAGDAVADAVVAYAAILPISTSGDPYPLVETDMYGGAVSRFVDPSGKTWIRLHSDVELPGEQLTDGSITEAKLDAGIMPRTSADVGTFAVTDQGGRISELCIDSSGRVPQWAVDAIVGRATVAPTTRTYVTYTLKSDGTGDYSTLADAVADLGTGAARQWIELVIHPGVHASYQVEIPNYWKLIGTDRNLCRLHGDNDDDATDSEISDNSTLQLRTNHELHNLTVTCRNMRYPIHDESYGADTDGTVTLVNCHIEHLGNQDARDWRTANPGSGLSPSTVWGAETAWGHGTSSGNTRRFVDTTFACRDRPWYAHDNKDFANPFAAEFQNCEMAAKAFEATLLVESLGSGRPSRVSMIGCAVSGLAVEYADNPWISVADNNQVANHAQIEVSIDGLDPLGFTTSNRGKAIKIESSSTTAPSSVRVSGTAADAIFGVSTHRDGGGGLKGYAYGQWDISGILCGIASDTATKNTLGRRLGDCSSVNKTLTVTVDGGTPIVITFSTNLTSASNATILSTINSALGSAATATEYLVTQGEEYPRFTSRIKRLVNHGETGIPRWSAVKQSGSRGIMLMGTGDPVTAFYGVTLEPITPWSMGRVLTSGRLKTASQMSGLSTSPTSGVVYFSDSTAGAFSLTGTRQAAVIDFPGWATFVGPR